MEQVAKNKAENIKNTALTLSTDGRFSLDEFWKIKKYMRDCKEICSSLIDNEVEVFDESAIKEAYKKRVSK